MTDTVTPVRLADEAAEARLRKRKAAERRFRFYGQAAIAAALSVLAILMISIVSQALPAFSQHKLSFDLVLDPDIVAPEGRDAPEDIAENVAGFYELVREDLLTRFPEAGERTADRIALFGLVTRLAVLPAAREVGRSPDLIGQTRAFDIALADDLDLYLKGMVGDEARFSLGTISEADRIDQGRVVLRASEQRIAAIAEAANWSAGDGLFSDGDASVLLRSDAVILKAVGLIGDEITADVLAGRARDVAGVDFQARVLRTPEAERNVTDQQIAWTLALQAEGRIFSGLNTAIFSNADSTYPEIAGTLAALIGSLLTMFVTAALAIPLGIMAAVYLEEFAPKNRMTEIIEVNINNLAAVPSIVFGLLGAAVFLNFFGLPRSAPLVGGMVLALMTLPTVIIAARASLKAVPPSIRDAALGVGASKTQAVFHHVLPLAAPGIMTGSIIGLARALGETAPLLLIGMVAFVAEAPSGPTDEATTLPVLIYKWSTGAERAWEPATAAAIIILLVFMVLMNALAVFVRRRFERRW